MESLSIIYAFIDDIVNACPDLSSSFKSKVPKLITFETDRHPRRLLKVNYSQRKSISLRSGNAFLDWRRFVKFLTEQVIDGASAYMVPILCIPIAIRMLCTARNVVSEDIGPTATGTILALYLKSLESSDGVTDEQLQKDTADLLKEKPFEVPFKEDEFRDALKLLVRVEAIQQRDSGEWILVDRVRITS